MGLPDRASGRSSLIAPDLLQLERSGANRGQGRRARRATHALAGDEREMGRDSGTRHNWDIVWA